MTAKGEYSSLLYMEFHILHGKIRIIPSFNGSFSGTEEVIEMVVPYLMFFHVIQNRVHWFGEEQKAESEKLTKPRKSYNATGANLRMRVIRPSDYSVLTRHMNCFSRVDNCDCKCTGLV